MKTLRSGLRLRLGGELGVGNRRGRRGCGGLAESAFTMIEIAISLAVIAFALVAIIGILPTGMNVQKDNRQETVINQDVSVFLNAIRGGARGADDLTNYVTSIRRVAAKYYYVPQGAPRLD